MSSASKWKRQRRDREEHQPGVFAPTRYRRNSATGLRVYSPAPALSAVTTGLRNPARFGHAAALGARVSARSTRSLGGESASRWSMPTGGKSWQV
ncbi:hypothetical protein NDU88_010215 [Pleurodeles waltl]|uniref:Uncharacterized protein n=1 Tax=Pleurodeles waltl TaxID=8319 RepID=A0AAV7QZL7_PLEWA|nr:hypothetical protein NDU88_010215 [Pleurodeles waltl]